MSVNSNKAGNSTNKAKKMLIIEDHMITAELLALQIQNSTGFIIADILKCRDDIYDYENYAEIDVIISDYMLSDIKGCEIIEHINTQNPDIKVIVLSGYSDITKVQKCFELGVHGYISKESPIQNVENSIHCVLNGGNYICDKTALLLFNSKLNNNSNKNGYNEIDSVKSKLTKRENEILKLIAAGKKNSEIAEELYISERTVETHRRNILKKFDQDNIISVINKWLDFETTN